MFERYLFPSIASPDTFNILEPGKTCSADQKKRLGSVAKVLHLAVINSGVSCQYFDAVCIHSDYSGFLCII